MWCGTDWSARLLPRMKKQGSSSRTKTVRTGWRWLAGSFLWALAHAAVGQVPGQAAPGLAVPGPDGRMPARCGIVAYEQVLQRRNPLRQQQIAELNRLIERAQANGMMLRRAADVVYRIPIVVHVVHNNASNSIGGANNVNISDEQIISQIQVLNEDYRRQPGTNGYNDNPLGADAGIEFFLAETDPQGQSTTGITRHYYPNKTTFSTDPNSGDDLLLSQIAYWPSDRYLNIWVTRLSDNFLGYTQFPTAAGTLTGLPSDTDERVDGSIIDYQFFGRQIGTARGTTYGHGRTATHEIGHWLGLIHLNGDTPCGDDYVADTPRTDDLNQTVYCRETFSTCSGARTRNQIENYMMYSPDLCMNLFTQGQVDRMRAVLALSPRRVRLIQSVEPLPSTDVLTINVYPNPAEADPTVEVRLKGSQAFALAVFDISGRLLRETSYANSPSTRVTLPIRGLATGMYIVRVKTDSEVTSRRLLVR